MARIGAKLNGRTFRRCLGGEPECHEAAGNTNKNFYEQVSQYPDLFTILEAAEYGDAIPGGRAEAPAPTYGAQRADVRLVARVAAAITGGRMMIILHICKYEEGARN